MAEQNEPRKAASGAFISPGELQQRAAKPQADGKEPKRDAGADEGKEKTGTKIKPFWYILPGILLIAVICILFIPRGTPSSDLPPETAGRERFTEHGFILQDASLHFVARAYFEDLDPDPRKICEKICGNIDAYTQAFTVQAEKVALKEISSKALIAEVKYSQNAEEERDISFAVTDPKGNERLSGKHSYQWKTEETLFANLDMFFENGIAWETGNWHITLLTNDREVKTYSITIVD